MDEIWNEMRNAYLEGLFALGLVGITLVTDSLAYGWGILLLAAGLALWWW